MTAIHVSVGLAAVVENEKPAKAIRLAINSIATCQDTEALISVKDARMVAALLITAADELQKQELSPALDGFK